MSRVSRSTLAAGVIVVIAAVVAFVGWSLNRDRPLVRQVGDDPRIFVYASDEQAPLGLGAGLVVGYDPGSQCLYVYDRRGDPLLPIWPRHSKPVRLDTARGVQIPGQGLVTEGDMISDASIFTGPIYTTEEPISKAIREIEIGSCIPPGGAMIVFYEVTGVSRDTR
jgi:hypothetical protein